MDSIASVEAAPRARQAKRWTRRRMMVVALAVVVVVAAVVAVPYRRQITSYLTHWKGSPTHTEAYVPFPADDPPALHIAVLGDIGDSGSRLLATAAAVARLDHLAPYDVLLLLGDNVYPAGDPAVLPDVVFGPFAPVLEDRAELLAILGNHDVAHGDEQMEALGMPGRWWSVERADVLVVGLDSNEVDNAEQQTWLEETLRESTATWKVVALHHPPYSAGYQGSNKHARAVFSPLFERYGVQLVLSGHDHDYQRSEVIRGVTYVVTGAASGTRRTGEASFTAVSFSWHSFVDIGVYPDRMIGRAVNQSGRVADDWVLHPQGS